MAFEFITAASRTQKIVMGVFALAVLGGAEYFFLLRPQMEAVEQMRARNASLQSEVTQQRVLAARLAAFRQEAAALRQRLEAAKERLPTEKEVPRLYRQISNMAVQTGLAVSLFQPKQPKAQDAFDEIAVSFTAEAGYHQLGAFFERIAQLPRVVTLNEFKLQGIQRPTGTLRAELTLATYVFRPEGAPPPPPPKTKGAKQ